MEAKKKFEGRHSELTGKILGAFFELHKELGLGFTVERQKDIYVYYHGKVVGEYKADMIVNGVVLLELKSVERLTDAHDAQLLNYLKATELEVGLLLNFGRQVEFRRKIYDNPLKGSLSWVKIS